MRASGRCAAPASVCGFVAGGVPGPSAQWPAPVEGGSLRHGRCRADRPRSTRPTLEDALMKRGLFFPIAPLSIVLLAIVAIFSMSAAEAVPVSFFASLDGAAKVPPVMTSGTGLGVVVLEVTAHTIQINVTFSGLTSPTTAAHIHCCQPLGTNAGVATTVPGFPAGG